MDKLTLALSVGAIGIFGVLATAYADPPRHPPNAPPPPPPEAFEACANQSEGSACAVHFHGRDIQGTCAPFHDRGLACRPDGPPPPPPG